MTRDRSKGGEMIGGEFGVSCRHKILVLECLPISSFGVHVEVGQSAAIQLSKDPRLALYPSSDPSTTRC